MAQVVKKLTDYSQKELEKPAREVTGDLWKALAATAFPIVTLSVIGAAPVIGNAFFELTWLAAAVLLIIACLSAILFTRKGEKQIAKGIWLAIAIGGVTLFVSCAANIDVSLVS